MTSYIQQGLLNRLVLTLQELKDPNVPDNFLFVFTKDQGGQIIREQLEAAVSNPRYDLFTFTEGGEITFPYLGDYEYKVYQMPDDVSTDETEGVLLEIGKVRVVAPVDPLPSLSQNNETAIYEQYTAS